MKPRSRRLGLALAVATAAACVNATDGGGPAPVALLGAWSYEGTQDAPYLATLTGLLTITSQSGRNFGGTLDVTESSGQGTRRLSGLVSGRALDSMSLDFDVFLEPVARRHLAGVTADSIKGEWAQSGATGVMSSGSFKSARRAMP